MTWTSLTPQSKVAPSLPDEVEEKWFFVDEACRVGIPAAAADLCFVMERHDTINKLSWTVFNELHCKLAEEKTVVGFMPIVQAPAHDMTTLSTVISRCRQVARALDQRYVVLTADEALYCRLMLLKWADTEDGSWLIVRLGGLHTAMNFLRAIGQHMDGSGLAEVWKESGTLGAGTTDQVLAGKAYKKAMRAHKLTYQALWRMLLPELLGHLKTATPVSMTT